MRTLTVSVSGPSASAEWPVSRPDPRVDALKQELSEQEAVIAVQSNMLDAMTAQAPAYDREIVKTLDVFQGTQEKQQQVIDSLVEENKLLKAQLVQSDNRLQEAEKTHAAYKAATEQLIQELRAQHGDLTKRVSVLENKMFTVENLAAWLNSQFGWFCSQFTALCNQLNANGVYPTRVN